MNVLGRCVFFANIVLPGHRNKRKGVLEIKQNLLFLYSNYKIVEQEMNKMAIHTHVNFTRMEHSQYNVFARCRHVTFFCLQN